MQEAPSPPLPTGIPSKNWEQTPVSVKRWVENQQERIKELEEQQAAQRQVCWAHLKRDFIKISELRRVSQPLGEALLKQQEKLFELW